MFIKICGVTNEEDALLATALGTDAVGFVFAPSSRQIHPETARDIVRRLPREVVTVGVFRDERPERILEVVNRVGLHGVQLHGREPISEVRWVRERVPFVIQGFAAGDPAIAQTSGGPADVVLVDAPNPGSGQVFDWSLAEGVPGGVRLLLAGGLTPSNVGEAIRRVRPWGVDVSSGVEASPGRKDPVKLRVFIEAARDAATALEHDVAVDLTAATDDDGPYDWALED